MRIKTRLTILAASLITAMSTVSAHNESGQGYYGPRMMWGDGRGWMHNGAHMAGYNMWGMGWLGLIPGLIIWTLAILGLVFLYQKVTEEKES